MVAEPPSGGRVRGACLLPVIVRQFRGARWSVAGWGGSLPLAANHAKPGGELGGVAGRRAGAGPGVQKRSCRGVGGFGVTAPAFGSLVRRFLTVMSEKGVWGVTRTYGQ